MNNISDKSLEQFLNDNTALSDFIKFPFPQEIIDFYRDSDTVHISDDGMRFSVSFGIPLKK